MNVRLLARSVSWSLLSAFGLPNDAAAASVFVDDASGFRSQPAVTACPSDLVFGFEELPLGTYVRDTYSAAGVVIAGSTLGALVDDEASGSQCVGTRCLRIPLLDTVGLNEAPWFDLTFDPPVQVFSLQLLDFGKASPEEQATLEGWSHGVLVDAASFRPGGDNHDGGVFLGAVFDVPVDRAVLHAQEPGDGIGFDDLWFPDSSCYDYDNDGVSAWFGDCDEADPQRHPGMQELCDGKDNDCDGSVAAFEWDSDYDAFMDCVDTDHDGVPTSAGDCAPWDATTWPSAPELCDGIDNACDGDLDVRERDLDFDAWLDCVDTDGDLVPTADGDCAPWNNRTFPGAPELCDGADNRCAGLISPREQDRNGDDAPDCVDLDADGWSVADGDCDDVLPDVFPGAIELCNGRDDACLGYLDEAEADADADGYPACAGDCADRDSAFHPWATDLADGEDRNCDGVTHGGTIGCSTRGATAVGFLPLIAVCLLLGLRSVRGRSRRVWPVWFAILSLPVLAAVPARLAYFGGWIDEVQSPEYQQELERTNHGKQVLVQLSEAALSDWVLAYLADHPAWLRWADAWRLTVSLPMVGPVALDFAIDTWVSGVRIEILDNQQLLVTLDVAGVVRDLSATTAPSTISGPVVFLADLVLTDDGAQHVSIQIAGTVDASGVVVGGYLGTNPALRQSVVATIENLGNAALGSIPPLPLDFIYDLVADPSVLPPQLQTWSLSPRRLALRTVSSTPTSEAGVLMLGFDITDLPSCHDETAQTGEDLLFDDRAFATFSSDLIPPGRSTAVSISTRLLQAVFDDLIWNLDVNGHDLRTTLRQGEQDLAGKWYVSGHSRKEATRWEGFETAGRGDNAAIADVNVPACDGLGDGSFVLAPDADGRASFWAGGRVHLDHHLSCDSDAGFSTHLRFGIDASDLDESRLMVDMVTHSWLNPTKWKSFVEVFGCDLHQIDDMRRELATATSGANAIAMGALLKLEHHFGGVEVAFTDMVVHPATLTLGGDLAPPRFADVGPSRWIPTAGAVAGFNIGEPGTPALADGDDPLQLQCPPGWRYWTRNVDIATFYACVWAGRAGDESGVMPAGAWCGLDVHPKYIPEICDNLDNDRDGEVDEGFSFDGGYLGADGAPVADCFQEYVLPSGMAPAAVEEPACQGLHPRDACPAGYHQRAISFSSEAFGCINEARLAELAPGPVETCALSEHDLIARADLVTCVKDEGPGMPDPTAPGGLVVDGVIEDFTWDAALHGGAEGPSCAPPWEALRVAAVPTGYRPRVLQQLRIPGTAISPSYGWYGACGTPQDDPDLDADLLDGTDEATESTCATCRSTDGDPLPDGLEVLASQVWSWAGRSDPLLPDGDGDALSDFEELMVFLTAPDRADDDGDGIPDGYEIWVTATDPKRVDTDGDGTSDGSEDLMQSVDDGWFWGPGPAELLPDQEGDAPADTDIDGLGEGE